MTTGAEIIIPLALQAVGTFAQNQANKKKREGAASAGQRFETREREAGARSKAVLDQLYPKFGKEANEAAIDQKAAANTATLQAAGTTPEKAGAYLPENPGAPTVVKEAGMASLADALNKGKSYAATAGRINAMPQMRLDQGLALGRGQADIGKEQGNIAGWQRVLEADLNEAKTRGRGWEQFGDIANAAGQLASFYYMGGGGAPAGGAGGAGAPALRAPVYGGLPATGLRLPTAGVGGLKMSIPYNTSGLNAFGRF